MPHTYAKLLNITKNHVTAGVQQSIHSLCYGLDKKLRLPEGAQTFPLLLNVPTGSEAHPAKYSNSYRMGGGGEK